MTGHHFVEGRFRMGWKDAGRVGKVGKNACVDDVTMIFEIKQKGRWLPIAQREPGEGWMTIEPGWKLSGAEPGCYDTMSLEYDEAWALRQ